MLTNKTTCNFVFRLNLYIWIKIVHLYTPKNNLPQAFVSCGPHKDETRQAQVRFQFACCQILFWCIFNIKKPQLYSSLLQEQLNSAGHTAISQKEDSGWTGLQTQTQSQESQDEFRFWIISSFFLGTRESVDTHLYKHLHFKIIICLS